MFWEWKRIPKQDDKSTQYIILITVVLTEYFYRTETIIKEIQKYERYMFFFPPSVLKSISMFARDPFLCSFVPRFPSKIMFSLGFLGESLN